MEDDEDNDKKKTEIFLNFDLLTAWNNFRHYFTYNKVILNIFSKFYYTNWAHVTNSLFLGFSHY